MSERKDIEIKDLPPEETLTPEEKERLAGAGRQAFRPKFDNLEARELMAAGVMAGAAPAVVNETIMPTAPAPTVDMTAGLRDGREVDLGSKDLSYVDFTNVDLTNVDLRGKNLTGSNLSGKNLQGKDMS